MLLLGVDIGGTKVSFAVFSLEGRMISRDSFLLGNREGKDAGEFITGNIKDIIGRFASTGEQIRSVGVSVPGISHAGSATVWAPNIAGWDDYPLFEEIKGVTGELPVTIDSDRACSILGELWQGNAKGCMDAVFLTIGTGIGAGILMNGEILRGTHDIAGAIGWMALERPFVPKYSLCGCFEYYASGAGIARAAEELLPVQKGYRGVFLNKKKGELTARDVFSAYPSGDPVAVIVINQCIELWGMAAANLVSLFNPEKIIFGGGVFGPARQFIPQIRDEAEKWAQPLSMKHVIFEASALSGDSAVYGAGCLALRKIKDRR